MLIFIDFIEILRKMILNSVYFTISGFEDLKWRIEQLRAVLYKWRTLDQLKNNREDFRHNGIEGRPSDDPKPPAYLQGRPSADPRPPALGRPWRNSVRKSLLELFWPRSDPIRDSHAMMSHQKLDSSLNPCLHGSIKGPLVWTLKSFLGNHSLALSLAISLP